MNPVLEQSEAPPLPARLISSAAPPLTLGEVGYGHRPGHGLGISLIAHSAALLAILLTGRYGHLRPSMVMKPSFAPAPAVAILVLPTLGGGSQGSGRSGGGQGADGELSSGVRAQSRRGFAYPGKQPLVSNPARAILGIQTILQPSAENLPHMRRYVPLPNIVEPPPAAASEPHNPETAIVVRAGKLRLRQTAEPPIAVPKIKLSAAADSKIADLAEARPQLPRRAVPDPVRVSEIPGAGRSQKGLLVLNAVPPPPDATAKIPPAEARSQFAVSPAEATIIADPAAGTVTGGPVSMAAGNGSGTDLPSGDALAEVPAGGKGANHGQAESGAGSGGRYGSGQGGGLNSQSAGNGTGRGSDPGTGMGSGLASGRGSGAGAGSAPGGGGFPGITIQGGRYGNGSNGGMLTKSEPRRQTSYNMTIVSTGSSGGGLPDVGVFHDEKVYTVYLDMRADDEDTAPSWTLQYAVLQSAADVSSGAGRTQGTPSSPYPVLKQVPKLTPELVRKYGQQLIVASGIIDASGKLEQVSVRQSLESQLAGPLVEALSEWVFEPARIDGRPVALKILLGIRLAASR